MARQTPREDIFIPIHKGIRSMIYDLGTKLQKTDFTDVAATNASRHSVSGAAGCDIDEFAILML